MIMRLLPALLLSVFLISVAAPASADPISALFVSVKALMASSAIASFLINTAMSLGLSLLAQALTPKPKQPGVRVEGTSAGEEIPQSFPLGRRMVGGHLEYQNSYDAGGTPNGYLQLVISLSDIPGTILRRLRVNDKWTALADPNPLNPGLGQAMLRFRKGGTDNGWIRFYDGTQTAADPDLVARYSNDPDQPWTEDHKLIGVAYAIITLRYDREVWQGVPSFRFVLDSIPVYDPRKDSTAGGSGAHRWDNPATWEQSENPVVLAYNVMRGITLPDGNVYGGGVPSEDLPLSNWIAGMNVCDQTVGERLRFTAGLEVATDVEPALVVEELLKACLGQISETGGVFRVRVAEPDMPVFAFTDGDVSISDPQQFDPFPGLEGTHNAIRITHPSASNLWEPVQTPIFRNADWEASDGGRRLVTQMNVAACFNHGQAQALARAYIEDARRFRTHQIVLPGDAQVLEALDTVEWTSVRNGYANKLFEVVEATYLPGTLFVALTIRERDPGDYDWSPEFELPPPPELDPTPVGDRIIPTAEWSVTAAVIEDETGTARRPAIRITWSPEVVTDARTLRYQVRLADTNVLATQGRATAADGEALVSESILPDTAYIVRLRPVLDRPNDWTGWKPVTTQDVRITEGDLAPELDETIRRAFERHDDAIIDAEGTIRELRWRIEGLIGGTLIPGEPGINDEFPELGIRREVMIPRLVDLDDQIATMSGYIAHLTALYGENQERLTSAGIYTDPESGEVRIAGFQRVDDRISLAELRINGVEATVELLAEFAEFDSEELIGQFNAVSIRLDAMEADIVLKASALTVEEQETRLNQAEVQIDGLNSAITLKADETVVSGLDARVNSVEANLDALDVPTIGFTVRSTRYQLLDGDERELQDAHNLLAGWLGLERQVTADAAAQFQIQAWTNDRLEAEASARLALTAEVGANAAALLQETVARANADSAIVTQINQLSADVGANSAAITTESVVRANQDSVLAGQISTLTGRVGDAEAEISTESTIRASADAALATQISTVSATANARNRTFRQSSAPSGPVAGDLWYDTSDNNRLRRWSGTAWVLTDDARIAQNAAAITTESAARASADEAFAGQLTILTATVSGNTSSINNLAATRVTAAGAVAAVNQQISASYGDLTALAEATAFAEATLDGISSGYVWSLGGDDVLSLIRVDDGSGPVTTARIRGDYIRLDGNTQITGSFQVVGSQVLLNANTQISGYLGSTTFNTNNGWRIFPNGTATFRNVTVDGGNVRSGNFSAGSDGWRILANGNAEFNQLTLREGIIGRAPIQIGAVSDVELFSAQAEVNFTGSDWETVATLTLAAAGTGAIDVWTATWATDYRGVTAVVGTEQVTRTALYRIQKRTLVGGVWSDWETVASYQRASTAWGSDSGSAILPGPFQSAQLRYQWSTGSTGSMTGFLTTNFRNRALFARRVVR